MGMIDDDLNTPLGQYAVQKHPPRVSLAKIGLSSLGIVGGLGLLGAVIVLGAPGALFPGLGSPTIAGPHPGGGFPARRAALHETASRDAPAPPASLQSAPPLLPAAAIPSGVSDALSPVTAPDGTLEQAADAIERQSGVKIIRQGGSAPPGALVIDVAKVLNQGLATVADPRLIEPTQYGPVPRIGADGTRAAEIYARPAVSLPGLPRIALLVGGLGLASRATEAAITGLPGAVTLGFAPYGGGLARQTALAREAGHELVLEIPMEPFDFPRDNPGPHTLVVDAGKTGNGDRLAWLMSRFTGYAGVANFLGGKFTADEKALTPVLHAFASRGLFYVDDGSSARSLAMTLAPGQALAAARADIILDSTAAPGAIEAALARLEAIARDKGLAIGVASALPESIETIGRFVRGLDARGIALVPLSAAMPRMQQGLVQQGLAEHQP